MYYLKSNKWIHKILSKQWQKDVFRNWRWWCDDIACITLDSVMKMKKMNYPQVYLEGCKYKIKKIKMSTFINTEFESESKLESETE